MFVFSSTTSLTFTFQCRSLFSASLGSLIHWRDVLHLMNFFKASSNFFSIGLCAFTQSCVFFAATTDTGVLLRSVLWSRLVLVCASNKCSLRYNECIFHVVCRCRSLHELTIYNFICDVCSWSHSAFADFVAVYYLVIYFLLLAV